MCRFFNVEVFVLTCPVVAVVVPSPASTVAAMAMPIEPPMVRKRLKSSPPGHSYARLTAKHRRNNEARDANNKDDALSPEPLSKKAADRNYDPLGHDIGRENPRDLIRRRSECAHHVGQGDVDHRHVENDHQDGEKYGGRAQNSVGSGGNYGVTGRHFQNPCLWCLQ